MLSDIHKCNGFFPNPNTKVNSKTKIKTDSKTDTKTDITTDSSQELTSLCIKYSRTELNGEQITWQFITEVFEYALRASKDDEPCKGCIKRVDRVWKKDESTGHPYMTIFIHFNYWPDNSNADKFRKAIEKGNEKKIYYHNKWFWKVVKSTKPPPSEKKFIPFVKEESSDSDSDTD